MAGDWIPFEVDTPRKSEVLVIKRQTGRSRHEVIGLLVEFWSWYQSVDGGVDGGAPLARLTPDDVIEAVGGDDAFWRAVAGVGWVVFADDGITLPNAAWLENGAKARLLKAKRQKRYREKRDGDVDGGAPLARTPEKRREEKRKRKGAVAPEVSRDATKRKPRPSSVEEVEGYVTSFKALHRTKRDAKIRAKKDPGKAWPVQPFDAEQFFNHYESNGWRQSNGNPIRDWQATARGWGGRSFSNSNAPKAEQESAYKDLTPANGGIA